MKFLSFYIFAISSVIASESLATTKTFFPFQKTPERYGYKLIELLEQHENPVPPKVVEEALNLVKKADVNVTHPNNLNTPLLAAISRREPELVKAILEKSSTNINQRNLYKFTPLSLALFTQQKELIYLLLEFGADVNKPVIGGKGVQPIIWAFQQKDEDLVLEFLTRGASPNATNKSGRTPLILAIVNNYQKVFEKILNASILDHRTETGKFALQYAIETDNRLFAGRLIEAGAKVELLDDAQWDYCKQLIKDKEIVKKEREEWLKENYNPENIGDDWFLPNQNEQESIKKDPSAQ